MGDELLIYGSYGYTGALIARTAVDEELSPVLAGRDAERVESLAIDLGVDHRVFSLEHPEIVEREVAGVSAVLNCAGPFSSTAMLLVSACLRAGTDYLDIAGEIDVLEAIAERDRDAEKADVTLSPAVGYDVVSSDCLAAYLESRLPTATRLTLVMDGLSTYSPGTVKSIVEGLSRPGAIRRNGKIRRVPAAWKTRRIDFGRGPKTAVTVPWGDVSMAYYTTGIPNIETYATVPPIAASVMRRTRPLAPVLGTKPVQRVLKTLTDAVVSGPTPEQRATHVTWLWGEVEDTATSAARVAERPSARASGPEAHERKTQREGGGTGHRVAARLRTPDIYDLTVQTAVEAARRVLGGEVGPGFQTPASAFGPDFVLEFEGVKREELSAGVVVRASADGSTEE